MDGIVCSNHGGRQLDSARSGIEVLPEVMEALRERGLDGKVCLSLSFSLVLSFSLSTLSLLSLNSLFALN